MPQEPKPKYSPEERKERDRERRRRRYQANPGYFYQRRLEQLERYKEDVRKAHEDNDQDAWERVLRTREGIRRSATKRNRERGILPQAIRKELSQAIAKVQRPLRDELRRVKKREEYARLKLAAAEGNLEAQLELAKHRSDLRERQAKWEAKHPDKLAEKRARRKKAA